MHIWEFLLYFAHLPPTKSKAIRSCVFGRFCSEKRGKCCPFFCWNFLRPFDIANFAFLILGTGTRCPFFCTSVETIRWCEFSSLLSIFTQLFIIWLRMR